ncbi:DNA-binding response regulator [Rhizocola hellebori]|uniref:DNA-binding response regulator n=1 Tax=Rhizocola hellebori TaxID=1392758 RepID=A0A8J3QA09_9ACTN|nr:response regulator transcription factor [Rhizocola hellebori]GIH06903.1 DNA-binding response regulator [Rhizocola hellebori]
MPPLTRVVLAEDEVLLREGLVGLLARFGFEVVAAVGSAPELLEAVDLHEPDLVVTDIRMPPHRRDDGLRAAVAVRTERPHVAVVVLSQYLQAEYAAALLDSGDGRRVGYLLKDRVADIAEFVKTLREVVEGGTAIDPDVIRHLLRRPRDPLASLSPREREVLVLLAEGHSNAAMAAQLHITEAAIGKHVGNILTKLDLAPSQDTNRRVLAVLTYLRNGPLR